MEKLKVTAKTGWEKSFYLMLNNYSKYKNDRYLQAFLEYSNIDNPEEFEGKIEVIEE